MVKFYYCPVCKKEIEPEDRIRKPMDSLEKVAWAIVIIGTVGIGLIPFLVYYFYYKKRNHCPTCYNKLTQSSQPFEKPEKEVEPKTPREKVLKKAGKKIERKETVQTPEKSKTEEKDEDKVFCPYCGTELSKRTAKCPNCGTRIKDRIQK
ncbi:MAG: hypothetical protein GF311_17055 [Candidatus Lokiarchaeota archaeon]|nr:hypothetical protein [Candidatus Lokiarchaeota archaeon]